MHKPRIETLASGYGLIEGPRADSEDRLFFSDVLQGGVYRRDPDGRIETVVPKRRGVGGIALHADGGVVVTGRNVCHVRDGESRVVFELADAPGFNDLITDAKGSVLTGSLRANAFAPADSREPGELYRIESAGDATLLYGNVSLSNGLGFSSDGRRLYHSDTARNQVLVHDVEEDGRCTNRRVFAQAPRGSPDGLAVDESGCVWIAAMNGGCVARFAPDGQLDRRLDVPAKAVTSLCFGGSDRRDLYIVSADNTAHPERGGTIFRTRVDVPGLLVPLARI